MLRVSDKHPLLTLRPASVVSECNKASTIGSSISSPSSKRINPTYVKGRPAAFANRNDVQKRRHFRVILRKRSNPSTNRDVQNGTVDVLVIDQSQVDGITDDNLVEINNEPQSQPALGHNIDKNAMSQDSNVPNSLPDNNRVNLSSSNRINYAQILQRLQPTKVLIHRPNHVKSAKLKGKVEFYERHSTGTKYSPWTGITSAKRKNFAETKKKREDQLRLEIIAVMRFLKDISTRYSSLRRENDYLSQKCNSMKTNGYNYIASLLRELKNLDSAITTIFKTQAKELKQSRKEYYELRQKFLGHENEFRKQIDSKAEELQRLDQATADLLKLRNTMTVRPSYFADDSLKWANLLSETIEAMTMAKRKMELSISHVEEDFREKAIQTLKSTLSVTSGENSLTDGLSSAFAKVRLNRKLNDYIDTCTVPTFEQYSRSKMEIGQHRVQQDALEKEIFSLRSRIQELEQHLNHIPNIVREKMHSWRDYVVAESE
ncbi:hypothetical protein BKA69DRAFT_1047426 [Paraphysoderma sedebokerense]|nr:hypothetical protein BKA69DRAFT_1047426 [Paraphysoderma sedebokerense]